MRATALVACGALLAGCFGYSPGARKWAYVGDTILVLGGAAAITSDVLAERSEMACTGTGCSTFDPPFGGAAVAGAMLLTAGVVGMIVNATRPTSKSSR